MKNWNDLSGAQKLQRIAGENFQTKGENKMASIVERFTSINEVFESPSVLKNEKLDLLKALFESGYRGD